MNGNNSYQPALKSAGCFFGAFIKTFKSLHKYLTNRTFAKQV